MKVLNNQNSPANFDLRLDKILWRTPCESKLKL